MFVITFAYLNIFTLHDGNYNRATEVVGCSSDRWYKHFDEMIIEAT